MTESKLDGKKIAEQLRQALTEKVSALVKQGKRAPGLAVVLVGEDAASEVYVRNKRAACEAVGMVSEAYHLDVTLSEIELLHLIQTLNQNPNIDGILVQLPLPKHIDTQRIIEAIDPKKDVDGFHPYNLGRLAQKAPLLRPCTPYGIIQLLEAYNIPIKGQHAVVIGASNIVGRPMCLEFLLAGATVTCCHKLTQSLDRLVKLADILVVAAGVQEVVLADWLEPHQVIVDVGIHRLANGEIRGDVDYQKAAKKVSWITPVPGGVGPMTVTALLQNTLQAYYL